MLCLWLSWMVLLQFNNEKLLSPFATGSLPGKKTRPDAASALPGSSYHQMFLFARLPKYAVRVLAGIVLGEIMGPATFAGHVVRVSVLPSLTCSAQVVGGS